MQSSEDECSINSESDDSFDDGYDENLMAGEDDKNWLMKLSEMEREMELYERFEKREHLKTRFEIKRKLQYRKKRDVFEKGQTDATDLVNERKAAGYNAHQADLFLSGRACSEENDGKTSMDEFFQSLTGVKTRRQLRCLFDAQLRCQDEKGLKTVNSNQESKPSDKELTMDNQLDGPSSIETFDDNVCVIIFEGKTYQKLSAKKQKTSESKYKSRHIHNKERTTHIELYKLPFIYLDDEDCAITFEGKTYQRQAEKKKQSIDSNKRSENPCNEGQIKDRQPDESPFVDRSEDEHIIFDSKTQVNNPSNFEEITSFDENDKYTNGTYEALLI